MPYSNSSQPTYTRRDILKALGAGIGASFANGLEGLVSPAQAAEAKTVIDDITKAIPDGKYRVTAFTPSGGSDAVFLYVLTPVENGYKAKIFEPYYVSDKGTKTTKEVSEEISKSYGDFLQPFELVIDAIRDRNAKVLGYAIRRKGTNFVSTLGKNNFTLYLKGHGTAESGGAGAGAGVRPHAEPGFA